MIITGGEVYNGKDGLIFRDIYTNGAFISGESEDGQVLDASCCYVIPGLIDLHLHGCNGVDLSDTDVDSVRTMAEYEAACGVTSIVPAMMSLPKEKLEDICRTISSCMKMHPLSCTASSIEGLYMEGPFLSPKKKGAQNGDYLCPPDAEVFHRLNSLSEGMIKILGIAPELPGSSAFIRELADEVILSVAHTEADYDTCLNAFKLGVHHVTHLYNGMPEFLHRMPSVVGAAADTPGVFAELICDGVHVHPSVVRQTLKMFGEDRIIFISDSMEAAGMPDGEYRLGGQPVTKKGSLATLPDGTIAGSVSTLMDCVRTAVLRMGIPLTAAVRCAAENPARRLGIFDRCGSIEEGKLANLVILHKEDLTVKGVVLRGNAL